MRSKFSAKIYFQLLLNSTHVWNQSTHNILSDIIGKSIEMRIFLCVRQPVSLTSVHLTVQGLHHYQLPRGGVYGEEAGRGQRGRVVQAEVQRGRRAAGGRVCRGERWYYKIE